MYSYTYNSAAAGYGPSIFEGINSTSSLPSFASPPVPALTMSSYQLTDLSFKIEKLKLRKTFFLKCIEHKVLPRGLRLKFNLSSDAIDLVNLNSDISTFLQQASSRILDRLLQETNACLQNKIDTRAQLIHADENTSTAQLPLKYIRSLRRIRHSHDTKFRKLISEATQTRHNNRYSTNAAQPPFVRRIRPSRRIQRNRLKLKRTATAADNNLVVSVPESIRLSDSEKSILAKGLKFVPLQQKFSHQRALQDAHSFIRILRLKHHFHDTPDRPISNSLFSPFGYKSSWTPPTGNSLVLDYFVQKTLSDLNAIKTHPLKKTNISPDESTALRNLRNRKDIVIKPADKGGAVVVWDRDAYIDEANRQLHDESFYATSPRDTTATNNQTVKTTIANLIDDSSLPPEASSLVLQPSQLGKPYFYMLPKIHKMTCPNEMPPGRPIVSAIACPTEKISQFLDSLFQPIVNKLPTYVKDTTHALHIIDNINSNNQTPPTLLFTMDVKALYTSIPHDDGLKAIQHFFTLDPHPDIPVHSIVRLTELVLTLNSFEFNGNYFDQISGVAMGTKMGPSYANLFMGHLEQKILADFVGPSPEHLHRYIDDYFGATTLSNDELNQFLNFADQYHPSIGFTNTVSDVSVDFLDISVKRSDTAITTSIHYKVTDSHSYLLYSSSHPKKCKDAIPYSQLLRLRRLCSDTEEFHQEKGKMLDFFRHRGYPDAVLRRAANRTLSVTRDEAMCKRDIAKEKTSRPVLALTYHPHSKAYRDIILKNYKTILQSDDELSNIFAEPPMVAWRRDKSLRDILVHSRVTSTTYGCMVSCGRRRCDTCTHLYPHPEMQFPLAKKPIVRSSCTERNVVYGILCDTCGTTYIGQTGKRLGDRVVQHLRDIRLDNGKPVARHFNMMGHRGVQDLKVAVIMSLSGTEAQRRKMESELIQTLGTFPFGINERNDIVTNQ